MTTEIFIVYLFLFILFISFLGYAYYRLREFGKSLDRLVEVSKELSEVCREINQMKF